MVVKPSALEDDAPPLGYAASSAHDVLAWLRHERSGAFCICPKDCDADLIFVLKRRGGYFWVILRTAGRGNASSLYPDNVFPDNTDRIQERKKRVWDVSETPITSEDLDAEFERLAVENLFSRSESASDTLSTALSDAFAALPNGLAPDGQLSLLRVVGVFPSAPPFTSKKVDGSSVAVLNTSTFKDITEAIPATEIIEPLIKTLQDRRSQFADEAFTIVKPPSKQKAKRKQRPSAPGQADAPAEASSSLHHDEPSESLADSVQTAPAEKVDDVSVEIAPVKAIPIAEVTASPVREAKRTKTL
ncbi:hypothetical protein H0H93_015640 [Arthromyces matolae]|nr:hypothetical protein H0H93_015640 [Arthromyces matolae]